MSEKDIPVMFRWETPWRPNEIEQLQANLGLHPGRTRDINTVMGYVIGQAIKTYRADPDRWTSYSRNQNWYRDPSRQQYFPVRTPYASMRSAIDQLAGTGAIEHRKSPRGNLGQQSRFRATADLYRAYTQRPVPLVCTPRERIISSTSRPRSKRLRPRVVLKFNRSSQNGNLRTTEAACDCAR
jgi:hypothetical protein